MENLEVEKDTPKDCQQELDFFLCIAAPPSDVTREIFQIKTLSRVTYLHLG